MKEAPTKKPESKKLPDHIDGIDLQSGLLNVNGNHTLFLKVLSTVFNKNRDIPEQIQTLIETGDIETAYRMSHTFKGVAGTIGAKELYIIAKDLENSFKENDLNAVAKHMKPFSEQTVRIMNGLTPLFGTSDAEPPAEPSGDIDSFDKKRLKKLFEKLAQLIDEGDSEALELAEELQYLLADTGLAENINSLVTDIDDYEFEQAEQTLTKIRNQLK
ncbi:MAG: Hpt domain-containing protein [Magnetococcales bacterium]|nr:Hpt domain-containing protein [Magnetococcales bacterium]